MNISYIYLYFHKILCSYEHLSLIRTALLKRQVGGYYYYYLAMGKTKAGMLWFR